MDPKQSRSSIFRHLDGIVITPIIVSFSKKNIFNYLKNKSTSTLSELCSEFQANDGYMNVALRNLASQGFLNYKIDNTTDEISITPTSKLEQLLPYIGMYEKAFEFLKASLSEEFQNFELGNFSGYGHLLENFQTEFEFIHPEEAIDYQVLKHIEGALVGPLMVQLGMRGMFHKYFMESYFQAGEFHRQPKNFEKILDFLTRLGWFTKHLDTYSFTETGIYFAKRATSYGVTVSYLPLLVHMDDLLFGDSNKMRENNNPQFEGHVNRKMNVWGSGGAHSTYFKVVTNFIIDIFNQPLEKQPKGVLDMGCGNGAFIQHIYETIERHTLRGKHLTEYPLFLVGADYNTAALEVTRANLIQNDIWAKVIWGDIGDPNRLAKDLKEHYSIELSDLLNVRTFLDHNRIWTPPTEKPQNSSTSTGAFAYRGKRLSNNDVEWSLKEHLGKWVPYIKKNGLLVIELHTIAPELCAAHLGETAATAYDATHGFSDQYILEIEVFQKVCQELGLQTDSKLFKKFPDSDLATVSINLLRA